MTDRDEDGKPSARTRRWIAQQEEVRKALAEDREHAEKAKSERLHEMERDYASHSRSILGLLVPIVLLIIGWLIFEVVQCDPLYSDAGLYRSRECR